MTNPDVYAIIAADTNPIYLFTLPFVVLSWHKIAIRTLIICIGDENDYLQNELNRFIIDILRSLNVRLR